MNKAFAFALSIIGAVSAAAGALPAMAQTGATSVISASGVSTTPLSLTVHSSVSPINSATLSATIPKNNTASSMTASITTTAFLTFQSFVAVDCTTSSGSDFSVGNTNTVSCPSGNITAAQAMMNVN